VGNRGCENMMGTNGKTGKNWERKNLLGLYRAIQYLMYKNFSGEFYTQKQTWVCKSLVFKLWSFLHARIWRTKHLVSITTGRTHTVRLYLKLPTAQWWSILILLKLCMQSTRWRQLQSPSNCTTFPSVYDGWLARSVCLALLCR
jgi:hypothetical protein